MFSVRAESPESLAYCLRLKRIVLLCNCCNQSARLAKIPLRARGYLLCPMSSNTCSLRRTESSPSANNPPNNQYSNAASRLLSVASVAQAPSKRLCTTSPASTRASPHMSCAWRSAKLAPTQVSNTGLHICCDDGGIADIMYTRADETLSAGTFAVGTASVDHGVAGYSTPSEASRECFRYVLRIGQSTPSTQGTRALGICSLMFIAKDFSNACSAVFQGVAFYTNLAAVVKV